ncbi:uncharacterized protein TNCV_1787311 [Trichonephila clavipes]|nr:uncharacterized protein TNCV_1787311 [Trichonephila clavipes]
MNEQNINLNFSLKLGKKPTVTYSMLLHVYEDQELSMKCVYVWFARFREGRESVSGNPRSERRVISISDKNIEKVSKLIPKDSRLSVSKIAVRGMLHYIEILTRFMKGRTQGTTPVHKIRFMVFCSGHCSPSHSQYRQNVPRKKGEVVQIEHPPFLPDLNPPDTFHDSN